MSDEEETLDCGCVITEDAVDPCVAHALWQASTMLSVAADKMLKERLGEDEATS